MLRKTVKTYHHLSTVELRYLVQRAGNQTDRCSTDFVRVIILLLMFQY